MPVFQPRSQSVGSFSEYEKNDVHDSNNFELQVKNSDWECSCTVCLHVVNHDPLWLISAIWNLNNMYNGTTHASHSRYLQYQEMHKIDAKHGFLLFETNLYQEFGD